MESGGYPMHVRESVVICECKLDVITVIAMKSQVKFRLNIPDFSFRSLPTCGAPPH